MITNTNLNTTKIGGFDTSMYINRIENGKFLITYIVNNNNNCITNIIKHH